MRIAIAIVVLGAAAFILLWLVIVPLLRKHRRRTIGLPTGSKRGVPEDFSARKEQATYLEPRSATLDDAVFTLTAPRSVPRASAFNIVLWLHPENYYGEVISRAKLALGKELTALSDGPFTLRHGTLVTVVVQIEGVQITPTRKVVHWSGSIGSAAFVCKTSAEAHFGNHVGIANVRVAGLRIATVHFVISVSEERRPQVASLPLTTHFDRNAFASYASEDREYVLTLVRGMQAACKRLNVFVDIVDLRAGQYWESELKQQIRRSDIFYLFWCNHASDSSWVNKEWRYALQARGLDFIDPVPLVPVNWAPPPKELEAKHFNDPLLFYWPDYRFRCESDSQGLSESYWWHSRERHWTKSQRQPDDTPRASTSKVAASETKTKGAVLEARIAELESELAALTGPEREKRLWPLLGELNDLREQRKRV